MIVKDATELQICFEKRWNQVPSPAYDSVPNQGSCCHRDVHLASGLAQNNGLFHKQGHWGLLQIPWGSPFFESQQFQLLRRPPAAFTRTGSSWCLTQELLHKGCWTQSSRWCCSMDLKGILTEQEPPDTSEQGLPAPCKPLAAIDLFPSLYLNRNLKPLLLEPCFLRLSNSEVVKVEGRDG